jgi:hypothetical protein
MKKLMPHKIALVVAAIAVGSAGISADALARGGGGGGGGGHGGGGFGGGGHIGGGFGGGHIAGGFSGGHLNGATRLGSSGAQRFSGSYGRRGAGHRGHVRSFGLGAPYYDYGYDYGSCQPYGYYRRSQWPYDCY